MIKKKLDIVVPVYNEGSSILNIIDAFDKEVITPHNIIICFDEDDDSSVDFIKKNYKKRENITFVKNKYKGAHGAVMSGIEDSLSDYVLVIPADDDYNQNIIDKMVDLATKNKIEIVAPCRFTKNSKIENGPFFKFLLVRLVNFTLYHFARVPSKDSTNGFRMFSRKVINNIQITSKKGFTYSIEYLLKSHEKKFKCIDYPANWKERKTGESRFRIFGWSTNYLRWYFYAWKVFFKNFLN
jgi:glycosyltransferase involved in cell wall biosynthesis